MGTSEEMRTARTVVSASGSLLLAFISGLLYSTASGLVKLMDNIHPAQLLFYRYCIMASMSLPQIVWLNENILGPPGSRTLIYLRSAAACASTLLYYISVRYLPVGEAAVIANSYLAFTTIAAKIFLNESFGLLQVISVILVIIGMIFVSGLYERMNEESFVYTTDNIYGLAAGLAAVICATAFTILTRKMKHVHNSVLLFLMSVAALIESTVAILVLDRFRLVYRGLQQFFVIFMGISGFFGSSILIIALQNMDAGSVSTMRSACDICFAFLFQVMLSHDIPNSTRILGAVLVGLSTVLVGFSRRINTRLPKMCVKFC